jgi:hypothetical protein
MKMIRQGSRGPQVKLLQRLLNLERRRKVLAEDGVFGPITYREVVAFQSGKTLKQDGIVGPRTWRALKITVEIDHRVTLFAQPTNMTCWSAAATMLFGNMSIGPGNAVITPSGGLASAYANVQAFARSYNLVMHAPMTWTTQGFANLIRRGPLWVGGVQPLGSPKAIQSGHVVVVGAMWGNGSADGTMLLIYDPWPPNKGSIYGVFYGDRIAGSPLMTMYILHRQNGWLL